MSLQTEKLADSSPDDAVEAAVEEAAEESEETTAEPVGEAKRRIEWARIVGFGVLPALALILALGAGFLKWQDGTDADAQAAAAQSVQAATDSAIAMLSYKPDSIDADLGAAANRLTGPFRDEYTNLINGTVAPGAKQQHISAVATVPAAASVSASANHAVVLLAVNQVITIGSDPPTNTSSSVRMTLDKVGERWLVSQFEPV